MAESNQKQPKRRGPGKPFAKGQSGNPGGRPKEVAEVRELARQYTEEAVDTLATIMRSAKEPAAARVRAAESILDRGYGKASQPIDGDGDGGPLQIIIRRWLDK